MHASLILWFSSKKDKFKKQSLMLKNYQNSAWRIKKKERKLIIITIIIIETNPNQFNLPGRGREIPSDLFSRPCISKSRLSEPPYLHPKLVVKETFSSKSLGCVKQEFQPMCYFLLGQGYLPMLQHNFKSHPWSAWSFQHQGSSGHPLALFTAQQLHRKYQVIIW